MATSPAPPRSSRRSLVLKRELGDKRGMAMSLSNLGLVARDQGCYPRAAALGTEALELFRALAHGDGVMCALLNLGDLARLQGGYRDALPYYRESATLAIELQSREQLAGNLEGLAAVALWQGLPDLGTRLRGAAAGLRERIGAPIEPALRPAHERTLAALARAPRRRRPSRKPSRRARPRRRRICSRRPWRGAKRCPPIGHMPERDAARCFFARSPEAVGRRPRTGNDRRARRLPAGQPGDARRGCDPPLQPVAAQRALSGPPGIM